MIKHKTTIIAALAGLLAAAALLSGGVAAVGEDAGSVDGYPDTQVTVIDAPEQNYSSNANVKIDVSTSALTDTDLKVETSETSFSDVSPAGNGIINAEIPQLYIGSAVGDSLTVDIVNSSSGATEDTVVVETIDANVSESVETVNSTTIKTAQTVNVTVDVSELNASDRLTTELSIDEIGSNIYFGSTLIYAVNVDKTTNSGNVTFNASGTASVYDQADALSDGVNKTLFVPSAVRKVTADGQVLYDESNNGGDDGPLGGGGESGGDGLGVGAIAAVLVLLAALLVARD